MVCSALRKRFYAFTTISTNAARQLSAIDSQCAFLLNTVEQIHFDN